MNQIILVKINSTVWYKFDQEVIKIWKVSQVVAFAGWSDRATEVWWWVTTTSGHRVFRSDTVAGWKQAGCQFPTIGNNFYWTVVWNWNFSFAFLGLCLVVLLSSLACVSMQVRQTITRIKIKTPFLFTVSVSSFRRPFSNTNLSSPLRHAVTGGLGWIGWRDSLTREELVGSAHPHPPLHSQRAVRQPNCHQCTIMPSAMSSTLSLSMFTCKPPKPIIQSKAMLISL